MMRLGLRIFAFALFLVSALPLWAAGPPPGEITIEEFLQKLSTVPDVVSRKDPFIQAPPPFEIPKSLDTGINMAAPVLERYPARDYGVVATLLGDQYPRALLRLPQAEKGKVLIVKEKDRLGNRSGVITKITSDGVVVLQTQRSPLGFVDKTEVVLRVGVVPGQGAGAGQGDQGQPAGDGGGHGQGQGQGVPPGTVLKFNP
jgi:hypothetical protein